MKRLKVTYTALFVGFLLNLVFINAAQVPAEQMNSKGLKPLTAEENQKLEKKKVKKVHLNKMGLKRVNEERKKKHLADLPDSDLSDSEIVHEDGSSIANGATATGTSSGTLSATAAQVDNSMMVSFPQVGNQGNEGSCVAWASTYYQMSHEVCLALGCDNKNSMAKVFSPKWTYNMINMGSDGGSYFSDAFNLETMHGAALMSELPYAAGDYRSWDLNSEHWRTAINSKMSSYSSLSINTDAGMANAKQLLTNGHVLVIGTYITSWVFRSVQANPNVASNPFVGQAIASYMNGSVGGHAMTMVGYDDNIWTDINDNGVVEPGELGAFKIANSWGAGWRNGGYAWISYDSLRATSSVPGFAPAGRQQLTQSGSAYTMTFSPYTPKLLAKVTLSSAARNQVAMRFGASATSATTAQTSWSPVALSNDGGAYGFDGSANEVPGTFYFDISSLQTTSVDQLIFYAMASDSATGSPLTISSFQLVDPAVNTVLNAAANVPLVADASTQTLKIGNFVVDSQAPSVPAQLTASVVSQKKGRRVTSSISLKWLASTDNVGVAKYAVYRNGAKLAESSSTSYSDSSAAAGVSYTYQVTAIDAQGNESAKSNSVSISK